MNTFKIIKRPDINPTDLSFIDNTLSAIKQDHDKNISNYNNLVTKLSALPVDESNRDYVDSLIIELEDKINNAISDNGSYHLVGDVLTEEATKIATDKKLQQMISNKAEYDEHIKSIENSKIPEDMKRMYIQKEQFSEGIREDGKWKPITTPVSHIDINVIEKYTEENFVKEMKGYGDIYYKTSNGQYSTDQNAAINSQPYYLENGQYQPIDLTEMKDNMVKDIYSNPNFYNSLNQEYEYYKFLYDNGELTDRNPILSDNKKMLTLDQFIEKKVNGFYNDQSLDIYYSNTYINPSVVNSKTSTKTFTPIIRDSNGNIIYQPTNTELKELKKQQDAELKAQKEKEKFNSDIDNNRKSIIINNDKSYNANNSKNLFDSFHASQSHLQSLVDQINKELPEEEQIKVNGLSISYLEERLNQYYKDKGENMPYTVYDAINKYKNNQNIINHLLLNTIGSGRDVAFRYYVDTGIILDSDDNILFDRIKEYDNLDENDKNKVKNDVIDKKFDINTYLTDKKATPIYSISNNDLYRMYSGTTTTTNDETEIERKKKQFIESEKSSIAALSRNGANYDIYIGDDLTITSNNDMNGTKRNAIGSLVNYVYTHFPKNINISYDSVNLNAIISVDIPFKTNKEDDQAQKAFEKYLKDAGIDYKEGETITLIFPDFMNNGLKNEHLNTPELQATQEITQILYSNLESYHFDIGVRHPLIEWKDPTNILFNHHNSEVNVTREDLIKYKLAENKYNELKYIYKNIDDSYNLTEKEASEIIQSLMPLLLEINKDGTKTDNEKKELIVNEICLLLNNINPYLYVKFEELIYADK